MDRAPFTVINGPSQGAGNEGAGTPRASKSTRAGRTAETLRFGRLWDLEALRLADRAAQLPGRGAAKRPPKLEIRTLNEDQGQRIPYSGEYPKRGKWATDRYTRLRNAAWAVRNSRTGANFNPLALHLVLKESESLVAAGEPLRDVLEAYAELLITP